jgi:hypothetical protein
MSHEFGHALGLPDLYDLDRPTSEANSAGIGAWGLMGRGTNGWAGNDGPLPFGAYSRERLGWLGADADACIYVDGDTTGLVLEDLDLGGSLARIPVHTTVSPSGMVYEEYLLLEMRVRAGQQYYDRNLPEEGVLVWHVRPQTSSNDDEMAKQVDVVCADGLFADRGYPEGVEPAPYTGRDNLDFWDHDEGYRTTHGGNLGDATDLFDGVRFTRLEQSSNPSSAVGGRGRSGNSGLTVTFARDGDRMRIDVRRPRWSGTIEEEALWIGDVTVDADLLVSAAGRLVVYRGTHARFAPGSELAVAGVLEVRRQTLRKRTRGKWTQMEDSVLLESAGGGATWRGLRLLEGGIAELPDGLIEIRDTLSVVATAEPAGPGVATAVTSQDDPVATFALGRNYPNPFQGTTRIPFSLGQAGPVRLEIFSSLGQRVATPVDEFRFQGDHELVWTARDDDGRGLAGGVYLYQMTVPNLFVDRGKMLFLGGMANLSNVEHELRAGQLEWEDIGTELATMDGVLGYGALATSAESAYEAGLALGLLHVLVTGDRAPAGALVAAERLAVALRRLGADEVAQRTVAALSAALVGGVEGAALADRLLRVERVAQPVIGAAGPQADVFYQMGAWVQHLRVAAVSARLLGRPLRAFADPFQNAEMARYFARQLPTTAGAAMALQSVARTVESAPASGRDLRALLSQIDAVGVAFDD